MRNIRVIISLAFMIVGTIGILLTIGNYKETRNVEYEYIVENDHVNSIYINDYVAAIKVLPATGSDIVISWEEDTNRKANHVTIDEYGNQLEIKRQRKSSLIFIPRFNMRQQSMTIYIPEDRLTSINIKNAVGSVLVSDVQVDELKVQADVQKIDVENVRAKIIHTTSSVGSISIENSIGEIIATSNVGSVDLGLKEITGNIEARSDVGSVKLVIDEEPKNVSFAGSSDIGSVRIFGDSDYAPLVGAEYQVNLKTDIGKVEVRARY